MPTVTLDPSKISATKLAAIYNTFLSVSQGHAGGTVQMTDLLDIISFPADVRQRIQQARGPVTVSECSAISGGHKCKAKNTGTEVAEDIPGSAGAVGIIIETNFSCLYQLQTATQHITIDTISGLRIDLPGPVNPTVDEIVIEVPNKVVKITF